MGKKSGVDWTDKSHGFWYGCRKTSPGCKNCYAERDMTRYGKDFDTVTRAKGFSRPLSWKESALIFVCPWSDFFIEDADEWRNDAWDIIRRTPHLTYQILTKRPENIKDRLPPDWPLPNVWLGVTAENQDMANERIPILLRTPAVLRFVSVEPMVGKIIFRHEWLLCLSEGQYMNICECGHGLINWVICGGESGPEARDMDQRWALNLKEQCLNAGWPFFMKQMSGGDPIPVYLEGKEMPK